MYSCYPWEQQLPVQVVLRWQVIIAGTAAIGSIPVVAAAIPANKGLEYRRKNYRHDRNGCYQLQQQPWSVRLLQGEGVAA